MTRQQPHLSRRGFCLCCVAAAGTFAATGGWLSPRAAYAEARGLVSLIKDSAAASPIMTHKLRNNINVLEGSGGNVAVLTGPDGKVLVDAGISVSREQMKKGLASLSAGARSPARPWGRPRHGLGCADNHTPRPQGAFASPHPGGDPLGGP